MCLKPLLKCSRIHAAYFLYQLHNITLNKYNFMIKIINTFGWFYLINLFLDYKYSTYTHTNKRIHTSKQPKPKQYLMAEDLTHVALYSYLNNSNLLKKVSHWFNSIVIAQALHKDGVIVWVILVLHCWKKTYRQVIKLQKGFVMRRQKA